MKQTHLHITIICFSTLLSMLNSVSSQTCQKTCGNLPLKFPFGGDPGCGDPRFHQYITCIQQKLTFTTHTGSYTIINIDYTNRILYITDPSMSTCDCTQQSKGFGLDWDAPFTFHDKTIFALLDCSINSSPIYNPDDQIAQIDNRNSSRISLCDNKGIPICSFLYSCRPISNLNIPISACCVYTPLNLGPTFEMDLEKLKCRSYSGFYSFNGRESDAESWSYGIGIQYKFGIEDEYPSWCGSCERSNGVCGYSGAYDSFVCNCPGGFNTSTDCFFGGFNHGSSLLSLQFWNRLSISLGWLFSWIL